MREVAADLDEGADMVMVKPGPALSRHRAPGKGHVWARPTFAYQVSANIR